MSAKQLVFDAEARRQLKTGIDALANAVKVTLGPRGRNVAIDKKWGAPTITHDGVTVAKEIELEDHFQNMGAQMLKQAATKTNDVAGDGTTTATVLAQAIVTEGLRNLAAGANPMLLKRGIDAAVFVLGSACHRRLTARCARRQAIRSRWLSLVFPRVAQEPPLRDRPKHRPIPRASRQLNT